MEFLVATGRLLGLHLGPRRTRLPIALALTVFLLFTAQAGERGWIFSGQSNMAGGNSLYRATVRQVTEQQGDQYFDVYSAQSGKPIECWLDDKNRDYPALWLRLADGIAEARKAGGTFAGFVWYQGEANVPNPDGYQKNLQTLIRRVRDATGQPELPVFVVQLASATTHPVGWNLALLREAQVRAVAAEGHGVVVAAADGPLKDLAVHLSSDGHEIVAARLKAAVTHLVYGGPASGWGPKPVELRRTDDPNVVVVTFDQVAGSLRLSEGWQQLFGLSRQARLDPQGALPLLSALPDMEVDLEYPVTAALLGSTKIALRFRNPVGETASLSVGAEQNAWSGPFRRWQMELDGVRDESGHLTVCRTLLPVTGFESLPAGQAPPPAPDSAATADAWWIGINLVGRFPGGQLARNESAGMDTWRQAWWNTLPNGRLNHLFDHNGVVRPVGFTSDVWYMNPITPSPDTADARLFSGFCATRYWHVAEGLAPGASVDLALYLDQREPKGTPVDTRVIVARWPDGVDLDRPVAQVMYVPGHPRSKAVVKVDMTVKEHRRADGSYDLGPYQQATEENAYTGNVLVLPGMVAGPDGRIFIGVVGTDNPSHKRNLNAVQLRSRAP